MRHKRYRRHKRHIGDKRDKKDKRDQRDIRDIRDMKRLCLFARTAHSLRSATLASLAHSVHGLAHSPRSLPRETVEIHESVFMLRSHSKETNVFSVVTRNTPKVIVEWIGEDSFSAV